MISPGTDASGSSLPSTAHLDLARAAAPPPRRRSCDRTRAASVDRRAQLGGVLRLRDADARSEVRRLDEHRKAERGRRRVCSIAALVALPVALRARLRSRRSAAPARRTPASSPPCPCRRPTRARRRRHTARSRARAAPAPCRLRRTGRAAPGTRRRGARPATTRARRVARSMRQQRVAAGMRDQVRFARRLAAGRAARAPAITSAADIERRRPVGQRPAAVLLDPDRRRPRSAAGSRFLNTAAADASDTSCSPERPP